MNIILHSCLALSVSLSLHLSYSSRSSLGTKQGSHSRWVSHLQVYHSIIYFSHSALPRSYLHLCSRNSFCPSAPWARFCTLSWSSESTGCSCSASSGRVFSSYVPCMCGCGKFLEGKLGEKAKKNQETSVLHAVTKRGFIMEPTVYDHGTLRQLTFCSVTGQPKGDEQPWECLCSLITTSGPSMTHSSTLAEVLAALEALAPQLPSRLRFMIIDVCDLARAR